jgi:hypothetical protein
MIRLRTDCLVFETRDGGVPCPVELVIDELLGEAAAWVDPGILKEAAAGVLRYFRDDLGRDTVSVEEFSRALARVLEAFGVRVVAEEASTDAGATASAAGPASALDLRALAREVGVGFELGFFNRLRGELTRRLAAAPRVLRLRGLRGCVKHLTAAQRWCPRCRRLSGQILAFVDELARESAPAGGCALVVS